MTKTDKAAAIEQLKERFENNEFFYIADASTLSAEKTTELRGKFFEKGISMQVVKNTLARKALEQMPEEGNYAAVFDMDIDEDMLDLFNITVLGTYYCFMMTLSLVLCRRLAALMNFGRLKQNRTRLIRLEVLI